MASTAQLRRYADQRRTSLPRPQWAWLRGIDLILVLAVAALCTAGAASVYAATAHPLPGASGSSYYLDRDLMNAGIWLLLAAVAFRVGVSGLRPLLPVLYAGTCALLLLVLSPVGATINGAHAWFKLGPIELEPNELAKIVVILFSAAILGERRDVVSPPSSELLRVLLAVAVPLVLILAEPALGVTIVIAVLVPVLFAISGAPWWWVTTLVSGAVLAVVAAFTFHLLKPYQEQRLTSFTDPAATSTTTGYHEEQSLLAIGNGGLFGQGFLKGTQTNGQFVPEQQTDFVFTVAAEEGGFVTAAGIVGLLGLVLWRGLRIAQRATDHVEVLVATGIVTWLGVQGFVNIGMTMGIMPVTGLPLPFVSYGGSAEFADLFAIGLLMAINRNARSA